MIRRTERRPTMENLKGDFDKVLGNLEAVVNQIRDGENERKPPEEFSLDAFWARIDGTVKTMSGEATKICLAFSQPPIPTPQECQPFLRRIECIALCIVSDFYSLPLNQGKTLRTSLKGAVLDVLTSTISLMTVIQTEGCRGSKQLLQRTGGVWEYCDKFPSLPKDNKCAVYIQIKERLLLVQDALSEIEEALNDDDDDDDLQWSEAEQKMLTPAIGLVKVSRATLKKSAAALYTNGNCSCPENIDQHDTMVQICDNISATVDDLVASLYSPIQQEAVRENSIQLHQQLTSILAFARNSHFTTNADVKWLDFLTNANSHNVNKIKGAIPGE